MVKHKNKKIIWVATAILLCMFGWSALADETIAESEKPAPTQKKVSLGGSNIPNHNSVGTGTLFGKMMLAVFVVIALGSVAIYLSRKVLPKITNLHGKNIHVIETVHLGSRKTVHLIEVGSKRILIGSTPDNITKLADLTEAFPDESIQNGESH